MSYPEVQTTTFMRRELEEIPDAIRRLLARSQDAIRAAADDMQSRDLRFIVSVARGSSDHAVTYLKYAIELVAKIPVASIGPSISSIYGITLNLDSSACISISQSGKSPDITQLMRSAEAGGALTVAITNDAGSPLARASAHALGLMAGPERSVAATKSFVSSVVSGLLLLAYWKEDAALLDALFGLPTLAEGALKADWSSLGDSMRREESLFVLGRGPSLAIAHEVALKFKETCQIHAEAFSSAELLHGPVEIVRTNYPVLAMVSRDASEKSIVGVADKLAEAGADIFATSDTVTRCARLPFVASSHPLTDPLLLIVSFYSFVERLSRLRGMDPDVPRNLKKVTETV